jgi:hypothetical protein
LWNNVGMLPLWIIKYFWKHKTFSYMHPEAAGKH